MSELKQFIIDGDNEISLAISNGVFVPTGTSRVLIKAVKEYVSGQGKVLDLGSGSGIVGISLFRLGLVKPPLYASDLSTQAIDCLIENAKLYNCPVIAKSGSLFEPWKNEKFDLIIDDISGIAEDVARMSPWFKDVPCQSGIDGTSLVVEVLKNASKYISPAGLLFFPVISFSNTDKIIEIARENFTHVKRLVHQEWPLPIEIQQYISELKRLYNEGHIQFVEKFGMLLWFTDIYVAYND